jgi:ParB family chromosome partitioning protein
MPDNTTRKISEIKIGKRHRKDMGDIDSFADNIKAIGLLHPIVINMNDELIAGERRILAYQLLGETEIPVRVVDLTEIIRGEFAENQQRKGFTLSEAVAITRALKPMLAAEAKARQAAGGKLKAGGKLPHAAKGKTRDKVAKYTGVKPTSLRKAEAVVAASEAEPDNKEIAGLVKTMDETGKVDGAYKQLKAAQDQEAKPRMTPIIDQLKQENEEHLREIADLEERLMPATVVRDAIKSFERNPADTDFQRGYFHALKDYQDEMSGEAALEQLMLVPVENIVSTIIDGAGEVKAKAIAACIIKRLNRKRGRPSGSSVARNRRRSAKALKPSLGTNSSDRHETMWRDRWLADNPGRTAADYREFYSDDNNSEYWKWRRSVGEADTAAEKAAWLVDHPGNPLPEHMCSLSEAEGKEYDAWRYKRSLKPEGSA